jgi:integrase
LQLILPHIQNENIRALAVVLFCTGCRLGEAFMFKARDLKANSSLFVNRQLDRKLAVREVKNRKPHQTILLDEGREAFLKWSSIVDKESYRKRVQHPIINAAKKAFKDKERQISPHDLRHSYAVHMLGLGVPLDRVAKLLGDSVKTTEDYYAGFVMSSNEIDFVREIIGKAKKS